MNYHLLDLAMWFALVSFIYDAGDRSGAKGKIAVFAGVASVLFFIAGFAL